jgi:hypothetical protein
VMVDRAERRDQPASSNRLLIDHSRSSRRGQLSSSPVGREASLIDRGATLHHILIRHLLPLPSPRCASPIAACPR